ncbi:MAG TPA: hypothetical protein VEI97_06080 [bacterium]|nr:hypothetical protein [bacterium]
MPEPTPWYLQERVLIPVLLLAAVLSLLAAKALLSDKSVGQVLAQTFSAAPVTSHAPATPGAPGVGKAKPKLNPAMGPKGLPPGPPPPAKYTDLNGIWRARYEQAGDTGDFSDFRIIQNGPAITGDGAAFSQQLQASAAYTIEGSFDGRIVRFTDHLVEPTMLWCDGCVYEGEVNEELTRIVATGRCGGICSSIGGRMILERLPPEERSILQ